MATTTFTNGVTLTDAGWFNDADAIIYDGGTDKILVGAGVGTIAAWTTATGSGAPVRAVSPTITGTLTYGTNQVGVWTTPAFNAGDFTASDAKTWTVAAVDVTNYPYTIINKIMIVNFTIQTSTTNGGGNYLQIAIPASKVATKTQVVSCGVIDNGGSSAYGQLSVIASGTILKIARAGGALWSAATDTTEVFGSITFEIN